ncbi:hypothetical protein [Halocatena salina]|uniref:CRISPR-associated protein Csc3 n=1 Tax=Halocatena salina TaxID=2934340 RepID=A0A8U0ABM4_9EURY|nr:hypothetical protein [Halocatena salina]UPM45263.1 hypothetical protein MW046_19140 [Halocatena salina]
MNFADSPASAARYAHRYIIESPLIENIIEHAGAYDAKTAPDETTSLAAHLINAITIGVNTFVYTAVSNGHDIETLEEDIKVLAAALALHDTNKYVREAYDVETDGNTGEAFEAYFSNGDDFGIEDFLGSGYRDDLHYLVQHTEVNEDSRETRGTPTDFVGLERYCRAGDQIASAILRDGVKAGHSALQKKFDTDTVHRFDCHAIEQPILNDELLGATKEVISGEAGEDEYGVVVGSTDETILYLGESIDRDTIQKHVHARLSEQLIESDRYSFSCKLNWNSFDYDILAEFALDPTLKEEIIAQTFRELLHDGTAGVEGFEWIPEAFDEYFPILAKAIYIDGQSEFDDDAIQEAYDRIREREGPQKVKIHFIAYLIRHFDEHRSFLAEFAAAIRPELHADLEPENDAIGTAVDRFFDPLSVAELPGKEQMCFLCGGQTDTSYQKGHSTVYRSYEFSRRVEPHGEFKQICEVCNLEYALLADLCDRHGVGLNSKVDVAYYYFDDFVGDIRLRSDRIGLQQGQIPDLGDTEVTTSLVGPQYYVQPFRFGGHPSMADKNHRMVVVRQLLEAAQSTGMKVVLGRPFTRFASSNAAFLDEDPIREQELLHLDEADRFGPLPAFIEREENYEESHLQRTLELCRLISIIGQQAGMNNPYLQLEQDTFHELTDFALSNDERAIWRDELRDYIESYHTQQFMDMKTVAQRGIDLFGVQYDSKYKKTKVFREAIEAFLSAKSQGLDEDATLSYVEAQVYDAADREDYAGYATTDEAQAFVEAIRSYLRANDLYELKKLSDWENALVNAYRYAYEQCLTEINSDASDD